MTKILATFFAVAVATASGAATERDSDVVIPRDYLRTAAAACRANDFDTFFNDFMWSADVRRRYTGATVEERSIAAPTRPGTVRPATPDRFDIELIDYTYADAASVQRWEKDKTPFTELWLTRTKLPDGRRRVEYQPAILHDDGEGDGKTLIRKIGKPRAYVFAPVGGCWKLVQWLK